MEQAWNDLKKDVLRMRKFARSQGKYNPQTAVLDVVLERMQDVDSSIKTDELDNFNPNRRNLGPKQ